MTRPIINIDDLEYDKMSHGDRFEVRLATISSKIGARKLGYNVTVLPAGKRAFPFHCHRANEEMFFVLSGEGELRLGDERHPVRTGDVIACPPGGPETAHQLINTSDAAELRYLAVSTKISPELCEYPDSGKFGVLAQYAPTADGQAQGFRFVGRADGGLDYWDGE